MALSLAPPQRHLRPVGAADLGRRSGRAPPRQGSTHRAVHWLRLDGQTWHDYEGNLEENLQSLLNRAKSGSYRAPPVRRVHILCQKVHGHYAYYGITPNARSLGKFKYAVQRCWHKWLNRRNRERTLVWDKFNRMLERYPLPPVRIVRPVYDHAAKP